MKYKSIAVVFFWLFLLVMVAGCSKKVQDKVESSKDSEGNLNYANGVTLGGQESMDISQSYFSTSNHNVAKGENGYYFMDATANYIYYYDIDSGESIPLCGKAECKHNDASCDAYVGTTGSHILNKIYYYDGYLYLIAIDNGTAILERRNVDGSDAQQLGALCSYDEETQINLAFHDDSVYIFQVGHTTPDAESTETIKKFSLTTKTVDIVFSYTGINVSLLQQRSYGDELFFIIRSYTKENDDVTVTSQGLFGYNYSTGKTEHIIDADIRDYTIDLKDGFIFYYVYADGLYRVSYDLNDTVKIYNADESSGYCMLSFDGKNIYMDNLSWSVWQRIAKKKIAQNCWVLDLDGKISATVDCDDIMQLYNGDGNFMFAQKNSHNGFSKMVAINKSQIGNTSNWMEIE